MWIYIIKGKVIPLVKPASIGRLCLQNLIDLKNHTNKNYDQIADGTKQPKRTIIRIFKGETENPTITTLIPIVNYLGGNLSEIFSDTCAIVGGTNVHKH